MKPHIITEGLGRYVCVLEGHAEGLRDYLLGAGVACGPVEPSHGLYYRLVRLLKGAKLARVRVLLGRWVPPVVPAS